MKPKKILITGGTGFIGRYLTSELMKEGHYLAIVTRSPAKYKEEEAENQRFISWDANFPGEMEKAEVIINMAGENLAGDGPFGKRWTDTVKKKIYNSRIDTTRKLVEAINRAESKPEVLISASAINYYGDSGDQELDESDSPGTDFLADVCKDWENEALKASSDGVRVVIPRFGAVLEDDGGMLKKLKLPFSMFVGGPLGNGGQFISWIHMRDLCRSILFAIHHPELQGPYNATAPEPATMNELANEMGRVMNRPSFFKVPEFVLNIMLGEATAPILSSVRAQPKVLQKHGFKFEFEDIGEALADIL